MIARTPQRFGHPFPARTMAVIAIMWTAGWSTSTSAQAIPGPSTNTTAQGILQTVGTLTIAGVADQPVPVYSAGITYKAPESGGGAPPVAATFSAFTITKLVDAISPRLLVSAASGGIFPQARIDFYDPALVRLASYELTNVRVIGAVVASDEGAPAPGLVEEVSLDYARIKQTVFTPSGPVEGCWDRQTNSVC